MGFSVQEKHQYIPNGGNICTKRMVDNIVHSLNAINTTMNSGNNSLFNHFRSWQRSRKMKMLNKNQNSSLSFVDQQQQHRRQLSSSPMNNLCYQSVSINDLEQVNNNIKNPIQSASTTVKNYYCPTAMMMKTNRAKSTNSIVSFKNKGDGKIVLNVKNNQNNHQVMLNDNQLYSMDIGHQSSSFQNDIGLSNRSPSTISDFSSFYMSLEPPNDQYKIIAPNDPLGNENWYYGSINREQAIRLIQNCPTGSFVVRKSSSNDGCYALTVRVPYDYNHTGVSHYLILQTSDEQYKIKGFNKEFHSISSLITHHSIMKEQLPCTLRLLLSDNCTNNTKTILLSSNYNNTNTPNSIKKSKCQSFYNLNSSQIYCKNSKSKIQNYNSYNTIRPSAVNSTTSTTISCNDDRMVDVDLDPTYQRILENFRKVMAHCNN